MPTNLPPICAELEKKYRAATSLPEKIRALEAYIGSIPEHKGTMKLRAHLKTKLAKLREELAEQRRKRSHKASIRSPFDVRKEGAAQVVLVGLTQSGKSSLLHALTGAPVEVAGRPYTTLTPNLGMMDYEDVQIQLVDTPALMEGACEGKAWGPAVLSLARNADGVMLVLDASAGPLRQLEALSRELEGAGVYPAWRRTGKIEVDRAASGGVKVWSPNGLHSSVDAIQRILLEVGVKNAVVKVWGEVSEEDVRLAATSGAAFKPMLAVLNKADAATPGETLRGAVEALRARGFHAIAASAATGEGLSELRREVFAFLGVIRVYPRRPGEASVDKPFILRSGATVEELAGSIHKDLRRHFRFAKVWGPSAKYPGERVGLDFPLRDGDIVEIYAR